MPKCEPCEPCFFASTRLCNRRFANCLECKFMHEIMLGNALINKTVSHKNFQEVCWKYQMKWSYLCGAMEAIKLDWKSYEDRRISCVSTRANNRKKGGWVLGTSILPRASLARMAMAFAITYFAVTTIAFCIFILKIANWQISTWLACFSWLALLARWLTLCHDPVLTVVGHVTRSCKGPIESLSSVKSLQITG